MKTIVRVCVVFLSLILIGGAAKAQDTEFWFSAPETTELHGDRPIMMYFTAVDGDATVTFSQPALTGSLAYDTTFIVLNKKTVAIDFTHRINSIKAKGSDRPLDYGIHITSSNPITTYYEIVGCKSSDMNKPCTQYNSDILTLKGPSALGTTFFIPSQNVFPTLRNNMDLTFRDIKTSFDILATEDNTTITITPRQDLCKWNGVNLTEKRPKNVPFTISLNKGQVYVCEAYESTSTSGELSHLGGSKVVSDKPIAITVVDDSPKLDGIIIPFAPGVVLSGSRDVLADQIIPVNKLGTDYVLIKGRVGTNTFPNLGDFIFIIATEDSTSINIDGAPKGIIHAGETFGYYLAPTASAVTASFIKTSKPAYVWQVTGFRSEIGGAIIPPVECTGSTKLGFTRTNDKNFILNIMVNKAYKYGLLRIYKEDGTFIQLGASDFTDIGSDWSVAQLSYLTAQLPIGKTYYLTSFLSSGNPNNEKIPFHLGIINGDQNLTCRYGFFSSFNAVNNTMSANSDSLSYCEGETIELNTENLYTDADYYWIKDGDTINIANTSQTQIKINNSTANDAGQYILVVGRELYKCRKIIDTLNIAVNPAPNFNLGNDTTICAGNSLVLNPGAFPSAKYEWSTGETTQIITVTKTGKYFLKITQYGCIGYDTIEVTVANIPKPAFSMQDNICFGNISEVTLKPQGNEGGFDFILRDQNGNVVLTDSIAPKETALKTYSATVYSGNVYTAVFESIYGCKDSIPNNQVTIYSPNVNLGADVTFCEGDSVVLDAGAGNYKYEWSNGEKSRKITVKSTGQYSVKVTELTSSCFALDTIKINVLSAPKPILTFTDKICLGSNNTITLNPNGATEDFHFTFKDELNNIIFEDNFIVGDAAKSYILTPTESHFYTAVYKNTLGCTDSIREQIKVYNPQVDLGKDQNVCEGATVTLDAKLGNATYLWNTTETSKTIVVDKTGEYSIIVTDNESGCKAYDTVLIAIMPAPSLTVTENKNVICPREEVIISVEGADGYTWTSSVSDPTLAGQEKDSVIIVFPAETNTYLVSGLATNGCKSQGQVIITVLPNPIAKISARPNPVSVRKPFVTFTDLSTGNSKRLWNLGDGVTSTEIMFTHKYSDIDTATYLVTLYVENDAKCKDSTSAYVVVRHEQTLFAPNAFIPNDNRDGLNVFKVFGSNILDFEMYVYDRWGKQVFYTKDINEGWDGTHQGKELPAGTYTYLILYKDLDKEKIKKSGNVTLVR